MNGALDAAVGDLDVERVAFSDLCGGENGFAVRADDGEAQPQDTLRGASGDQFGLAARVSRICSRTIPRCLSSPLAWKSRWLDSS